MIALLFVTSALLLFIYCLLKTHQVDEKSLLPLQEMGFHVNCKQLYFLMCLFPVKRKYVPNEGADLVLSHTFHIFLHFTQTHKLHTCFPFHVDVLIPIGFVYLTSPISQGNFEENIFLRSLTIPNICSE